MYTIILFALIGFIIIPIITKEFDWDDFLIYFFISFLGGLLGLIIALALPIKYEKNNWTEKIVSLKDNNSVSGSFFLGCGQINGGMKYVYYKQNNDSSYQMWQANYYDAVIKYTNGVPHIIITDNHPQKSLWNKFAIDLDDESRQTYVFEVPKGSIKNSYELDAQ